MGKWGPGLYPGSSKQTHWTTFSSMRVLWGCACSGEDWYFVCLRLKMSILSLVAVCET